MAASKASWFYPTYLERFLHVPEEGIVVLHFQESLGTTASVEIEPSEVGVGGPQL